MPRNVEIKARIADIKLLKTLAEKLSGSMGTRIDQEDTFFQAPNGRLKLRELKGSPSQLIFYTRTDQEGPKLSNYQFAEAVKPEQLKETLGKALGVCGVVKKERWLYLVGQTRVHVDDVQGLGHFMELEVCLDDSQTVEEGEAITCNLMEKLQIQKKDLLTGAYMDMILKQNVANGQL